MEIQCTSRIGRVEVYARGARVVRLVEVPGTLAAGEVDLVVPGITLLAEPGSFGAQADGRRVLLVHAALDTPQAPLVEGETVQQLNLVNSRIWRVSTELELLEQQRQLLLDAEIQPRRSRKREIVAQRLADGLAAADLLRRQLEAIDQRTAALKVQLRKAQREEAELRLRDAQASEAARRGAERTTSRVTVRVGGDGPVSGLELHYFVTAARWWPRYTMRLTDGGRGGTLALEALIAQRTAEDWTGVKLSLSTADFLLDTQLPELPSLRLGRAQAPQARAFRPAPEGLDRLFEGYDRAFPTPARRQEVGKREVASSFGAAEKLSEPPPPPPEMAEDAEEFAMDMKESMVVAGAVSPAPAARAKKARAAPPQSPKGAMIWERAPALPPSAPAASMPRKLDAASEGGGMRSEPPPPPPEPIADDGDWRDFGRLELEAPVEGGRGRLTPARTLASQQRARAADQVERLSSPRTRDPRVSRGTFDHRHEAAGSCDLASDGLVHRLTIGQQPVLPTVVFRTVPREDPSVFREAELRNPFDAPLLDGPVDIYVEGTLVTTSDLHRVDRAGQLRLGLGIEDRVRVVRNGFAEEESAGLLGGSRSVSHKVRIELASSLNVEIPIEVVDRIPVADDKALEIKLVGSEPRAEAYDQADRGQPLRGGLRWKLRVPPGGKAKTELTYRLTFSAKDEIAGGNRRE